MPGAYQEDPLKILLLLLRIKEMHNHGKGKESIEELKSREKKRKHNDHSSSSPFSDSTSVLFPHHHLSFEKSCLLLSVGSFCGLKVTPPFSQTLHSMPLNPMDVLQALLFTFQPDLPLAAEAPHAPGFFLLLLWPAREAFILFGRLVLVHLAIIWWTLSFPLDNLSPGLKFQSCLLLELTGSF